MAKKHHSDKRVFVRIIAIVLCVLMAGTAVVAALMTVGSIYY